MPSSMFACVKLRGLPFGVTEAEVGMFLVGAAPCRRAVVWCVCACVSGRGRCARGSPSLAVVFVLGLLVACVALRSGAWAVAWRRAWATPGLRHRAGRARQRVGRRRCSVALQLTVLA